MPMSISNTSMEKERREGERAEGDKGKETKRETHQT